MTFYHTNHKHTLVQTEGQRSSSSDHEDGIQNTEPRWFWWIQQKHRATLVFHGSMNNWRLLILQENCIWNAVFQTSFPEVPRLELESKRDSSVPVVRLGNNHSTKSKTTGEIIWVPRNMCTVVTLGICFRYFIASDDSKQLRSEEYYIIVLLKIRR